MRTAFKQLTYHTMPPTHPLACLLSHFLKLTDVWTGMHRYVLLGLVVGSVFYALPVAVISAELACAAPLDGGLVAWVEEA